jgi:RNA-directed DNA polymerase
MNVWPAFAPLWRAVTGARTKQSRSRPGREYEFEARWVGLLVRLGLPPRAFADVLQSESLHPHFDYRRYWKRKKGGGQREIAEPDAKLKSVQYAILKRHLSGEPPHAAATAYQKGKSTAHHVWAHAGAEILVTADVQDFFPSTREGRVEDWWRERVDSDEARLLTLLTTDRGALPQGAPTSPALSNLVNVELDERLSLRATATGGRYTRYCDDLAFSWPRGPEPPSDFEAGVRAVLHEFGYLLHPEKGWKVYHQLRGEPEITGVILTHRGVRLPEAMKRKMRRLAGSDDPADARRLDGYLGYEAMVTKRPKGTQPATPQPARKVRKAAWLPAPRPASAGGSGQDEIPF